MARVRWFIPDIIASDISYFRVYVKKDGCDDEIFSKNVTAVDRSCTVGNILPRMGYTVTVEAVYDDGIAIKRCVRYNDFGKLIEARTNFSALFLHTINNYVMANIHDYTFPFISHIHFLLYTVGFYKEFIYTGKELSLSYYEDYGIKITFPEHHIERDIHGLVMCLHIANDDCVLTDDDSKFVSAIYRIETCEVLPSPATMEIQHSVNVQDSETASMMSFVRSHADEDLPYHFVDIPGGQFPLNTRFGKITLSKFSNFGIKLKRFFKRLLSGTSSQPHSSSTQPTSIFYCACVFKMYREPILFNVDIVVTQDLAEHITVRLSFT